MNKWTFADHALAYLARADRVPHRTEGEAVLLDAIPRCVQRFLGIGTGDGRLLALLKTARPHAHGIGLDFSPTMLQAARERFKDDTTIDIIKHDLETPLPHLNHFDAVVSSFAIHHCTNARKHALYTEVFAALEPGGVFCNLEHVASPTLILHERFLQALGLTPETEDPSNILLDLETQLRWLREIGFTDVDCSWKWLEYALLVGFKPI